MTSLPPPHYDFSLWYSPEDENVATDVAGILREHGFRGYVEHQDAVAGRPVFALADEGIRSSRVALLLLSPRSLGDTWCQRVAELTLLHTVHREGAKVIPVYVDVQPEQAPTPLRLLTGLEYGQQFFKQRLIRSVETNCKRHR